ncbi:MAG: bifunctional diaminohydroxyphosphoribosylaminopyrimidine deaminase/5-amino-6-(5-phosphoribosylamino)uracil reductase RibD [Hyphomicrobiaceae bacterium]
MASHAQTDLANMDLALRMAWRGVGRTGANPSVGAVIVDAITGEIIARGTTEEGGRPHAETQAIARAGERARGATMYVTLEPCSHFGKTPPCADAVVDAGIARVVVGVEDPDLRVSGRGIERLRRAGIEVVTGVLAAECRRATLGHIRRVTLNRPFVQVKLAVGADGLVPHGEGGKPVWVTGPEARAQAHLLRAQADAILIGIGTARADDPDLTCRLPGMAARSPLRVVLDSDFTLSPASRLMQTASQVPVMVFTTPEAARSHLHHAPGSPVEVVPVARAAGNRGLDLSQVLQVLAGRGITRLLVEGGPTIVGAFLDAGLADECVIMTGARAVGADRGSLPFGADGLQRLSMAAGWRLVSTATAGADTVQFHEFEGQKAMFTGLVTDVGEVIAREGGRFTIRTGYLPASITLGASICCDGCCLTATAVKPQGYGCEFTVDVSNETLSKTALGGWVAGRKVNLERSLKAGDELGGHIVSGHVDGTARIVEIRADGDSRRFTLEAPDHLAQFIAPKGSIALDGTSLTVNEVVGNRFGVNLIPHSLGVTTWGRKAAGDMVNIEVDMFARYVARLMEFRR